VGLVCAKQAEKIDSASRRVLDMQHSVLSHDDDILEYYTPYAMELSFLCRALLCRRALRRNFTQSF